MSTRMLVLGHSELMAQYQDLDIKISASFHHDSRRDKPSNDTARVTIRKTSFRPTSRRSSTPGQAGTCQPRAGLALKAHADQQPR